MVNDKYILALDGHTPVVCNDLMAWAKWFESADKRVAKTDIDSLAWKVWLGKLLKTKRWEPVRISTVFLGIDHAFGEGGPILFETVIFGGTLDQEMWRYSTWEKAEKGHQEAVQKVKSGRKVEK